VSRCPTPKGSACPLSAQHREDRNAKPWVVRYADGAAHRSASFRTMSEAQVLAAKIRTEQAAGDRVSPEPTRSHELKLVRVAVVVDPTEHVADITDDPPDNRVLEAAAEGQATVIISGDRHLLTLGTWRGIRILTPGAVMQEAPPD
jgi:predicted nucleic acid-binding protein